MAATLVLPTYNEAGNLEAMVEAVSAVLPDGSRILVVDDNSPDGTGRIADRLAAGNPALDVLHRTTKEGLGPAYVAGFRKALESPSTMVAQMDVDFSHNPADLARLIAAVEAGADMAIGSRYVDGGGVEDWGPVRRLISRGGSIYARTTLGLPVRDLTGGFKVMRREVLETIDLDDLQALGYAFQVEVTYRAVRAGFAVTEVPITFRDREIGTSKMGAGIVVEAAWRVPAMRWGRR